MSPREFLEEKKQVGWRTAFAHFYHRRHLPTLAYVLLAVAIAFTIARVSDAQTNARSDLRTAAVEVVRSACERDNETREVLRGLLAENFAASKQYVKEGLLTQAQADRSDKLTREGIKKLSKTDCEASAAEFKLQSLAGERESDGG